MNPVVTVVVCTRDRTESLRETLVSFKGAMIPGDLPTEFLIVDNGSTAQAVAVVAEAAESGLPVRHVHEPTPGLSHARNCGVSEATGEILLFTDDDVRVPTGWIEQMCRPIISGQADAVAGGVSIPPHQREALDQRDLWTYRGWWASTDEINLHKPDRMVGANMAVRRAAAQAVGGFDVELGAGALGYCEETLFSYQLLAKGYQLIGLAAPEAEVAHFFMMDRLTRSATLSAAQAMGRSHAYLFHHWQGKRSRLARLYVLGALLKRKRIARKGLEQLSTRDFHALIETVRAEAFCRTYLAESRKPMKYARDA